MDISAWFMTFFFFFSFKDSSEEDPLSCIITHHMFYSFGISDSAKHWTLN